MPGEMRFSEFVKLARGLGWTLDRVRGSHHVFVNQVGEAFPVPVHGGKVKPIYVKIIRQKSKGD